VVSCSGMSWAGMSQRQMNSTGDRSISYHQCHPPSWSSWSQPVLLILPRLRLKQILPELLYYAGPRPREVLSARRVRRALVGRLPYHPPHRHPISSCLQLPFYPPSSTAEPWHDYSSRRLGKGAARAAGSGRGRCRRGCPNRGAGCQDPRLRMKCGGCWAQSRERLF